MNHTDNPQADNPKKSASHNRYTDNIVSANSSFHPQDDGTLIATPKKDIPDNIWYANDNAIDLNIDFDGEHSLMDAFINAWQSTLKNIKNSYIATADNFVDEILIKLSQQQVNDALHQFVVQNVDMVHELRMELHDDWLRLHMTIYIQGIFAKVSCDFRLVQAIINADAQRFVFEQLTDVKIIELHSKQWWQVPAAKAGVGIYKTIMRQDPLAFALSKITIKHLPFATHKGRFIYLDIHRYLAEQNTIINTLKKVQVNHGSTGIEKLLLRLQINFSEVLSFGDSGEDIITEKDNPNKSKDD